MIKVDTRKDDAPWLSLVVVFGVLLMKLHIGRGSENSASIYQRKPAVAN